MHDVDRIVAATTDADRAIAERLTGHADRAPVVGEPFTQWVIEDAFRGERPRWEDAGAMLVADTGPYETMKLRLLNGAHSAFAHPRHPRRPRDRRRRGRGPELRGFVERLLEEELAPTGGEVPGIDLAEYRRTLFERFETRASQRLEQIATGAAQKIPLRFVEPARELLTVGREPTAIATVMAAYARGDGLTAEQAMGGADLPALRDLVAASL